MAARALSEQVADLLARAGLDVERTGPDRFVVVLPGTAKLRTVVSLSIGAQALTLNAFVCRRPDENEAGVHRWLLQRNARMFAMAFAVDSLGDVYLVGRIPVTDLGEADLDRLLGAVLQYSDEAFPVLLRLGFASAIRREHAWRVSRGESLANLAAFADLTEQPDPGPAGPRPSQRPGPVPEPGS